MYDTLLKDRADVTTLDEMDGAKLFIKSLRAPIVTMEVHDVPGHYCQNGYRTMSTGISLSHEDREAKEILARSGVKFEVIDLSEGSREKLVAWYRGVRKTPTLWVRGSRQKNYEGIRAISEYLCAK